MMFSSPANDGNKMFLGRQGLPARQRYWFAVDSDQAFHIKSLPNKCPQLLTALSCHFEICLERASR